MEVPIDVLFDGFEDDKRIFRLELTTDNGVDSNLIDSFNSLIRLLNNIYNYDVGYFAVFTDEGNGVVHCLIKEYMPKAWYKAKWSVIHNSFIVFQEEIYNIESISVYYYNQKNVVDVQYNRSWFPLECNVDFNVDLLICRECDDFRRCSKFNGIVLDNSCVIKKSVSKESQMLIIE